MSSSDSNIPERNREEEQIDLDTSTASTAAATASTAASVSAVTASTASSVSPVTSPLKNKNAITAASAASTAAAVMTASDTSHASDASDASHASHASDISDASNSKKSDSDTTVIQVCAGEELDYKKLKSIDPYFGGHHLLRIGETNVGMDSISEYIELKENQFENRNPTNMTHQYSIFNDGGIKELYSLYGIRNEKAYRAMQTAFGVPVKGGHINPPILNYIRKDGCKFPGFDCVHRAIEHRIRTIDIYLESNPSKSLDTDRTKKFQIWLKELLDAMNGVVNDCIPPPPVEDKDLSKNTDCNCLEDINLLRDLVVLIAMMHGSITPELQKQIDAIDLNKIQNTANRGNIKGARQLIKDALQTLKMHIGNKTSIENKTNEITKVYGMIQELLGKEETTTPVTLRMLYDALKELKIKVKNDPTVKISDATLKYIIDDLSNVFETPKTESVNDQTLNIQSAVNEINIVLRMHLANVQEELTKANEDLRKARGDLATIEAKLATFDPSASVNSADDASASDPVASDASASELAEAKQRTAIAEEIVKEKELQLAQAKTMNNSLEGIIHHMIDTRNTTTSTVTSAADAAVAAAAAAAEAKIAEAEARVKAAEERAITAEEKAIAAKANADRYMKNTQTATEIATQSDLDLKKAKAEALEAKNALESARAEAQAAQARVKAAEADAEAATAAAKNAETALQSAKEDLDKAGSELNTLRSTSNEDKSALAAAQANVDAKTKELENANIALQEANASLEVANKSTEAKKASLEATNKSLEAAKMALETTNAEISALQKQLEEARAAAVAASAAAKEADAKTQVAEKARVAAEMAASGSEKQRTAANAALIKAKSDLEASQKTLKSFTEDNTKLKASIENAAKAALNAAKAEVEAAKAAANAANAARAEAEVAAVKVKASKDTEINELRTQLQLCKESSDRMQINTDLMQKNTENMKRRITSLLTSLFKDPEFLRKIQNFILNGVPYPNMDKNIQDQIGSKPSTDMSGITKEVCNFFTYFNNIVDLHVQKILSVHSLKSDSHGAKVDIFHLFKAPLPEYDNESLLIEINKLFQVLFGYLNNPIESKKTSGITTKDPLMLNKTEYPIIIRILASLASTEFKDEYTKTEPRSFKNYPILDDLYEFEFLNALSVKFIEKNPDAKKLQIIAFVIKNYKPGPSTEYSIPITILAIKMIQLLHIKLNTDRFKTLRNYCTTVP